MTIKINNKETATKASTLQELAAELALPDKGVAIAISNRMIPRSDWGSTSVSEGMDIVIIKAVCGG